jgi:hypothetical protein
MMPDPLTLLLRLWRRPARPLIGRVCDGCDDDKPLTEFTNGRAYCERCGDEVQAMAWAKPVSR